MKFWGFWIIQFQNNVDKPREIRKAVIIQLLLRFGVHVEIRNGALNILFGPLEIAVAISIKSAYKHRIHNYHRPHHLNVIIKMNYLVGFGVKEAISQREFRATVSFGCESNSKSLDSFIRKSSTKCAEFQPQHPSTSSHAYINM